MIIKGVAKTVLACSLIAAFWFPALTLPTAVRLLLLLGTVSMRINVGDPIVKSLPASGMLAMSLFLAFG
jgi:hypothetical protein